MAVLPKEFAPHVKNFSDVISRKVSVGPTPLDTITDGNAQGVTSFELPIAGMIDLTQDIYLQFAARPVLIQEGAEAVLPNSPPSFPGNRFGHMIRSLRIFCNNVLVDECLEQGALNNLVQGMTTPWQNSVSGFDAIMGKEPQPYNPLIGSTPIGYKISTPDDLELKFASMGALPLNYDNLAAVDPFDPPFYDQRFPVYTGMNILESQERIHAGVGNWFRVPLSIPGSFLGSKNGLVPVFRLSRFRIEITLNTHDYIFSTFPKNVGDPPEGLFLDMQFSSLSVGFSLLQSTALARTYSGDEWMHSYLSWHRGQAMIGGPNFSVVRAQPVRSLIPIQSMFKSCRYLIGVLANPDQFKGAVPLTEVFFGLDIMQGGNGTFVQDPTNIDGQSDPTRFDNFYGLGGYLAGAATGPWYLPEVAGEGRQAYFGQDASYLPTAINFRHNGEWVYQQDLANRVDFYREIEKVFPSVRKSAFFSVQNFPGIRGVIVVNLGVPAMAEGFVSGRRTEPMFAVSYLKLELTPNFGPNTTNPTVTTAQGNLLAKTQLLYWVCHDRQMAVDMRNGACVVDY